MDDDKLVKSLMIVSTECRKINYKLINDMEKALTSFEKNLSKASITQINWLKDIYGSSFKELIFILNEQLPNLRSLQDKIFTKHLKYNKHIPTHITDLFSILNAYII